MDIKIYLKNLELALQSNIEMFRNFYYSKEGCLQLAKEIGYGLADFSPSERNSVMGGIYGVFAVKLYQLKPFVDSKEFYSNILIGINKANKYKNEKVE